MRNILFVQRLLSLPASVGVLSLCLVWLVLINGPAAAQGLASDMDLRGVKLLRVTASPTMVETLDCGIEAATLVRNLKGQVESEGLKPTDSDAALAVVTVLSARNEDAGVCSSTLMLGVYKKASFFDRDVGWIRSGYVVAWQSAVLVTSPIEAHNVQVNDALARLGDALLGDWRNSQRPEAAAAQ